MFTQNDEGMNLESSDVVRCGNHFLPWKTSTLVVLWIRRRTLDWAWGNFLPILPLVVVAVAACRSRLLSSCVAIGRKQHGRCGCHYESVAVAVAVAAADDDSSEVERASWVN